MNCCTPWTSEVDDNKDMKTLSSVLMHGLIWMDSQVTEYIMDIPQQTVRLCGHSGTVEAFSHAKVF